MSRDLVKGVEHTQNRGHLCRSDRLEWATIDQHLGLTAHRALLCGVERAGGVGEKEGESREERTKRPTYRDTAESICHGFESSVRSGKDHLSGSTV
jgi:hypothetical protein